MIFTETGLKGAYVIDIELLEDNRGFFARSFCKNEFKSISMNTEFVQQNISYNLKKGTIRGLHYQHTPFEEDKIVRCIKGSIFDVMVDIRRGSTTFMKWFGIELTDENRSSVLIPKGFAHGYQTLEDNCEISYMVSEYFAPDSQGTIHYNDPSIGIDWPMKENIIVSDKDNIAKAFWGEGL